ncbi:MAG: heavy-metal-associated domain-containing protein [Clostridia bacterium]|nr:heavy-metal-associated domain-containing protein [Clostridia bacterium]
MRLHYTIKGMTCAACVAHVERAIAKVLDERESANVSLLTNSVSLTVSDTANKEKFEKALAESIKKAGYALVLRQKKNAQKRVTANAEQSILFSLPCLRWA